ncbi:RHS repeat-associated core domain-containing protein [Nonomuraea sp. B12E4]|uniref:RHS repeat-associated core domain-containing protein n=1 Tax=Nonomuraea sp. B12E4 TaxID=3153564 RepID=UPI00325F3FE8
MTQRRQTPFGAARGAPVGFPGQKGFVGGTIDASTGLTHLGAREYDPSIGRFVSADPVMDLTDPQQMNAYTYSNNNPVTYADPTGQLWGEIGSFFKNAASAAVNGYGLLSGQPLALVVPGTEKERPTGRPTAAGGVKDGEVSPGGRYIAVPFLAPTGGPQEYLDVRVLDTETLRWTRVPSMPVPVDVKTRRMGWTPDGRLVLAGAFVTTADADPRETGYASMIVTWRPGERTLSLRPLPVAWHANVSIITP